MQVYLDSETLNNTRMHQQLYAFAVSENLIPDSKTTEEGEREKGRGEKEDEEEPTSSFFSKVKDFMFMMATPGENPAMPALKRLKKEPGT
jgi:hypothetical protein